MNVPPEQKSNQNKTNSNETKINKRKGKLPTKSRDNNKSKKIQETKKFLNSLKFHEGNAFNATSATSIIQNEISRAIEEENLFHEKLESENLDTWLKETTTNIKTLFANYLIKNTKVDDGSTYKIIDDNDRCLVFKNENKEFVFTICNLNGNSLSTLKINLKLYNESGEPRIIQVRFPSKKLNHKK